MASKAWRGRVSWGEKRSRRVWHVAVNWIILYVHGWQETQLGPTAWGCWLGTVDNLDTLSFWGTNVSQGKSTYFSKTSFQSSFFHHFKTFCFNLHIINLGKVYNITWNFSQWIIKGATHGNWDLMWNEYFNKIRFANFDLHLLKIHQFTSKIT